MANREIPFLWHGGVNTSRHRAFLNEGEVVQMDDCDLSSGSMRLRQGYAQDVDMGSSPQGSGWGKFGTGTQSNQYVMVMNGTMKLVDLTTTLAATNVVGATGLAAGDWVFAQFANYLYGGNATAGIGRKLIGVGSDGTGNWTALVAPTAPANPPNPRMKKKGVGSLGGGFAATVSTLNTYTNVGASVSTVGNVRVYAYTSAATREVTCTFQAALRLDMHYKDFFVQVMEVPVNTVEPPQLTFIDASGNLAYADPWEWRQIGLGTVVSGNKRMSVTYRLQAIPRTSAIDGFDRSSIYGVKFTFDSPEGNSSWVVSAETALLGLMWLSVNSNVSVGLNDPTPAFPDLKYEYTYYNGTTGIESAPSPRATLPGTHQNKYGNWTDVYVDGTAASGVTKIRIYRVLTVGGVDFRYRINEVNNPGASIYDYQYDVQMADEVATGTVYTPQSLPSFGVTALCSWRSRLVVAQGQLVYISRDSDPMKFASATGAPDPTDQAAPFTYYPDDKQGETIYGLVPADDLLIVTDQSVRALVGPTPDTWRNIRLDDSQGACGLRAWCAYRNGVLALSAGGRLIYYSAAGSWDLTSGLTPRIGNTGLKALATSSAIVAVHSNGRIEVRNGTSFRIREPGPVDAPGVWWGGTFAHAAHSLLYCPNLALRWLGSLGKLYTGWDDANVTDAGTAPTYVVTSREFTIPRGRVKNINLEDAGQVASGGVVLYPVIEVFNSTGSVFATGVDGKRNYQVPTMEWDESFWIEITGSVGTEISGVRVELEDAGSPGRQR